MEAVDVRAACGGPRQSCVIIGGTTILVRIGVDAPVGFVSLSSTRAHTLSQVYADSGVTCTFALTIRFSDGPIP